MNPFQKELAKKFKKFKKEAEQQIREEEVRIKDWIQGAKVGTEVVIDSWGSYDKIRYAIKTKDMSWQHTDLISDRQKLLEMVKENGWILIEPEDVQ